MDNVSGTRRFEVVPHWLKLSDIALSHVSGESAILALTLRDVVLPSAKS